MTLNQKQKIYCSIFGCILQAAIIVCLILFQHTNDVTTVWFANLFFLILLCDYAGFLAWLIRHYEKKEGLCIHHWRLAAVAACTGMFVIFFLGMEDTIKQYDATVYWIKSIQVSELMYTDLYQGLLNIKDTLSAEYGNLPVLLFAPFIRYFGNNNVAYCSLAYILYGIPAVSLLVLYLVRVMKKCGFWKQNQKIWTYAAFLCPAMLLPVLAGYLDIIGVVWIGVMLNLSLDWDYGSVTVLKDLVFVFLSVMLLFSRRWYAFYIVGFYFCFAAEEAGRQFTARNIQWKRIRNLFFNLILIAGISCLFIFMLNREVFSVFLGGNYKEAYAAYKIRPTYMDFFKAIRNLGGIFSGFAAIGFASLGIRRQTRKYWIKIVVPPAAAGILFGTVQSMGIHHLYLILPHLILLEGAGIVIVFAFLKQVRWAEVLLTALILLNMLVCFSPVLTSIHTGLLSDIRRYPEKMEYAAVVKEASHYLSELEGTVYICGEGNDVSCELLNRCLLPEAIEALPNMIPNAIVDNRDGFPSQAFLADYIVVRNPYETGFPDIQQVTYQVWQMLLNSEIGKSYYALDKKYALTQDGAFLEIYKKKRRVHPDLIQYVSDQIADFYHHDGESAFAYLPDWFHALANYADDADIRYYPWDRSVEVSGYGQRMEAVFETDGLFERMHFAVGNINDGDCLSVYADNRLVRQEALSWENCEFDVDIAQAGTVRICVEGKSADTFQYHIFSQYLQ